MSRTNSDKESGEGNTPGKKRLTRKRTGSKRSRSKTANAPKKHRHSGKRERKVFGVLRVGKGQAEREKPGAVEREQPEREQPEREQPEAVDLRDLWDTAQQLLRLASLQLRSQSELQLKLLNPKVTTTSATI
jgi:hypothetical protein